MRDPSLVPAERLTDEQKQWTKAYSQRLRIGKYLKKKMEFQMQNAAATRGELGFVEDSLNQLISNVPEQMLKELAGQDTGKLRDELINLIRKPEGVSLSY